MSWHPLMSSHALLMRIRILSESEQANLPQIRSWFNIDGQNNVVSLKHGLCASIPALRDAHIRATELVLTLDAFELLDDSAINILRDGDLICLRRRTRLAKRKAEIIEDAPRKRHHPIPNANTTTSSSSSSSSSSYSSSYTSSGSGSTSGSSSDSDSDSTSSSSSDDLPPRTSHPLSSSGSRRVSSQPMPAPVPPGFGKPQTHARNERRRKKRLAERADTVAPQVPAGSSNAIPLGAAKSVNTPEPMMMTLKNKNKRRGFKNAAGMPSHVTFSDEVAPNPPFRLVPPSERDHLPPRLFVTSVDVEAGMWPRDNEQTWDRKRKKIQRDAYGQEDEPNITLDYDGPPEYHSTAAVSTLDYTALEKAWLNAPPITKNAALLVGCVVGWQELGINPATVTPEMMLFRARVVSAGEDGATVVRLCRPGSGMVSFTGSDLNDEEEEVFSWDKILEMQWRLLPH